MCGCVAVCLYLFASSFLHISKPSHTQSCHVRHKLSRMRVSVPVPYPQVLVNITKAIPTIASQLGLNIEGLDKIPSIIEALDNAFETAKAQGLVVMDNDKSGRIDVAATLSALPDKVPLVSHVMSNIVPPPADLPKVQQSLDKLQKSLSRLADMAAAVMSPPNKERPERSERLERQERQARPQRMSSRHVRA